MLLMLKKTGGCVAQNGNVYLFLFLLKHAFSSEYFFMFLCGVEESKGKSREGNEEK